MFGKSKEKRFVKVSEESSDLMGKTVFVDTVTGVNYLFVSAGYGGGLTVLVDQNGKPIVSSPADYEKE